MRINSAQDRTSFHASLKLQGNVKLKDTAKIDEIVARLNKKNQYIVDINDNNRTVGNHHGHGCLSVIDIAIASIKKGKLKLENFSAKFDVNEWQKPKDVTPTLIDYFIKELFDEQIL